MITRPKLNPVRIGSFGCIFIGLLIAGCVHHREFSGAEQRALATPPGFLTGPMALLLTNDRSYVAEISYETATAWGSTQALTGILTAAGSKMAFQPELPKASRQKLQGRMVFVWNTAQGNGYALNDALQGYAPYSGTIRFTNVISSKAVFAPERIAGHECEPQTATAFGNDGSTNILEVWRAADLRGFPFKISGGTNSGVLTFLKLQFGPPAEFLMSSDGFTKYETPDAMVLELVARQHNLNRREGSTFGYPANLDRSVQPGRTY